jgi:hypothetical protein
MDNYVKELELLEVYQWAHIHIKLDTF